MNKEMIIGLKARKENVVRRMTALDIEKRNLEQESIHLCELVKLYESYSYDPIEEERKVTEELIKGNNKDDKESEASAKPKVSAGMDKIVRLLEKESKPLNISEISAMLAQSTGVTFNNLGKLVKDGRVIRDKYKKYTLSK